MELEPNLQVTLPEHTEDTVVDRAIEKSFD
jgi:hypothetical protein